MRISKEPEARKQEILETAMKLFAEKGYEKRPYLILQKKSEWHKDYVTAIFHQKIFFFKQQSMSMQIY